MMKLHHILPSTLLDVLQCDDVLLVYDGCFRVGKTCLFFMEMTKYSTVSATVFRRGFYMIKMEWFFKEARGCLERKLHRKVVIESRDLRVWQSWL